MKIILKCKIISPQFLIGDDFVMGPDNICQLDFLPHYQILLSGKYRTMRWIKTCPRKMFFCRFRQIKVGRWSICLPCSPCVFTWEVRGGIPPAPTAGLPAIICCCRPMANRDGILGTMLAGVGPDCRPASSYLLPWGVLGGVGGWCEGGRFPCSAADNMPGWEKAGGSRWRPPDGLSAITLCHYFSQNYQRK